MEEQRNEQQNEQNNKQSIKPLKIVPLPPAVKQKNSGCLVAFAIVLVMGFIFLIQDIADGDYKNNEYTAEDLQDAQVKRATGHKITREDEIMLDGFDDWKVDEDKYED